MMKNADLELAIPIWLARYVKGEITIDELCDWFGPAIWDVEINEPAAAALAHRVDALLMRVTDRELSEPQLRRKLAPFALPAMKVEVARVPRAVMADKLARVTPKRPAFA